jgi:hypothetical protein
MQAGRELDALVAEKVMGWKVKHMDVYGWMYSLPDRNRWTNVPHFSSNIADAWQVVEKARKDFGFIDILPYGSGYETVVRTLNGDIHTKVETAPHAICLAALRAFGVEV